MGETWPELDGDELRVSQEMESAFSHLSKCWKDSSENSCMLGGPLVEGVR